MWVGLCLSSKRFVT